MMRRSTLPAFTSLRFATGIKLYSVLRPLISLGLVLQSMLWLFKSWGKLFNFSAKRCGHLSSLLSSIDYHLVIFMDCDSMYYYKEINRSKKMNTIQKQYIIDEQNRKIAVQIPIQTFEKLEEILENYALVQLMEENEGEDTLNAQDAKSYYDQLEKAL